MTTLVIATDEAGYGPKLGPLVIAATSWSLPSDQDPGSQFDSFSGSTKIGDHQVAVADSKTVFQPSKPGGLDALHAVVSACRHWIGIDPDDSGDSRWLRQLVAAEDLIGLDEAAWLDLGYAKPVLPRGDVAESIRRWSSSGVQLTAHAVRLLTARRMNEFFDQSGNKSDLLSESTLGLVRGLLDDFVGENTAADGNSPLSVHVYCDRHGGRRYYAGVIQHCFDEAEIQIVRESSSQSSYALSGEGWEGQVHFTVKGDRFAPVSMSSLIAKYVREVAMSSLNDYFAAKHVGDQPLKRTAGYPVDADRFLTDIQPIMDKEKIDQSQLIRRR
ncbi:MAG: hypothetical protein AAGA03_02935 [Planctomycetota bacterium]